MRSLERLGLAALRRLDPEIAHDLSLKALRMGLAPMPGPMTSPRLTTRIAGLDLPNPVGLAAGYDKNAVALAPLMRAGFGFLEVGAATPLPQPGNPRPRLFRLTEDRAAINRFGFNNDGVEPIAQRLAARPRGIPVGLNLGANKESADRAADFLTVMRRAAPHCDFVTVNVSSPNTERLRDLQGPAALAALLEPVVAESPVPVFLKIAPDLDDDALAALTETARTAGVAAIVATNTTLNRSGLRSRHAAQAGGLSGAPLFARSTRVLARLSQLTDGKMPLIGVGGVTSDAQAWAKIRAGAMAMQIYTGMVYEGISLVTSVLQGLDRRLVESGYACVSEAVGTDRDRWL